VTVYVTVPLAVELFAPARKACAVTDIPDPDDQCAVSAALGEIEVWSASGPPSWEDNDRVSVVAA
jgi:hypothetical protein